MGVRGYVFLYEGPRSSGVGGYVFLGPLKTVVPTPLKKRGPAVKIKILPRISVPGVSITGMFVLQNRMPRKTGLIAPIRMFQFFFKELCWEWDVD